MSTFANAAFAALLCDWCLEVQEGQRILVEAETVAEPALAAVEAALLERGAWPFLVVEPAGALPRLLDHGRDHHLDAENPFAAALIETADASLRILAPTNTRELTGADPQRLARRARGQRELHERLLAKRWALSIWPTAALAQEAGMSLEAYSAFIARALFLDQADPAAAWAELSTRQAELCERLTPAREIRIRSEGTDISFRVEGRRWINSDGRRNMPSGEVFSAPHEGSAQGHVHFDIPSNRLGAAVVGAELTFVDGVVTEAHAEAGEDVLLAALETDPGARRLGEIGIGTNTGIDRATGSTLLDEKIGGTIHLALGRSYPECGGVNESAVHWDLVCDLRSGGELLVDGELLSRDGQFV
ncbi:MAG TPA: aminopeptidase [Solirubrobacteraceae bacterium]|nr:aminopeptidase [Solirubrobacteraceae bacterium]